MLHERYGSRNVLLTNAYELPDLSHVDEIEIGLKAITDSVHRNYTGVSSVPVLNNIKKLHRAGKKIFFAQNRYNSFGFYSGSPSLSKDYTPPSHRPDRYQRPEPKKQVKKDKHEAVEGTEGGKVRRPGDD